MSQSSGGSPVNFLDMDMRESIMKGLIQDDGTLPSFKTGSDTPPLVLEAAVACDRGTQASSGPSQDQETQVPVKMFQDQGTQAVPALPRSVSFTQTKSPPSTRDNVTEMPEVTVRDNTTQMRTVHM